MFKNAARTQNIFNIAKSRCAVVNCADLSDGDFFDLIRPVCFSSNTNRTNVIDLCQY